jgi:YD repeat-containing protein
MMKYILTFSFFLGTICSVLGQAGPSKPGDVPNFIPPTPEVSSLLKANLLSTTPNTGAANFSIPLFGLKAGSFSLPISLNYNSGGLKVDEVASFVGMGWTLNYGGVVSRQINDIPDEGYSTTTNHNTHDFSSANLSAINYIEDVSADKQSDVFSFFFPGYSGKFVLDANLNPKPLSQYNLKISLIGGNNMTGFKIIAEDGTEFYFQDAETSVGRPLTGTNCKGINEYLGETITSWYLSKIVAPSRQKEINYTYTTSSTSFMGSLNESFTKNIATEYYECTAYPQAPQNPIGPACPVNETRFTSCAQNNILYTKFISTIQTSDGDRVDFYYDAAERIDLYGGRRITSMKLQNYKGNQIKYINLQTSYQAAIESGAYGHENYRLFLDAVHVRDNANSTASQLSYKFSYHQYNSLPRRRSFAQDVYGFYNGKLSNTSMIPKLPPSDLNYSYFNNGTGLGSVVFGDRSFDEAYAAHGMLTRIEYPTGGYDMIEYTPNYVADNVGGTWVNTPCGGVAVKAIKSYTQAGSLALHKSYEYHPMTTAISSAYVVNLNPTFSEIRAIGTDNYTCSVPGGPEYFYCVGPACTKATTGSQPLYPLSLEGGQHVYYTSVLEKLVGPVDNGVIEHNYQYYLASGTNPIFLTGSTIYGLPSNTLPFVFTGEHLTRIYKYESGNYVLQQKIDRVFEQTPLQSYNNYFYRKNFEPCLGTGGGFLISRWSAFDVMAGKIFFTTNYLKSETQTTYITPTNTHVVQSAMEYDMTYYNYPKVIKAIDSKGIEETTTRLYPPDFPSLSYMTDRNIISSVAEEKQYYGTTLLQTATTTFADWFSNNTVIAPVNTEVKTATNVIKAKIEFVSYDAYGNVQTLRKENDAPIAYFWGYGNQYPVAKIIGKTYSDAVTQSGINVAVLNNAATTEAAMRTELNKLRTLSGCLVSTYTHTPLVGVTSETDPRGRTSFYEYDAFGRLALIRDHDGNILKKFCYNYAGQPEDCGVDMVGNVAKSGIFTRNNCGVGNTGSSVTYSVPANTFYATSQAAADAMAQAQVDANGQAYANANGTCTPVGCSGANCSGENKKCVGGVCETGFKVYTSSVWNESMNAYECTYHYEFSDFSWSANYVEYSGGECPIW